MSASGLKAKVAIIVPVYNDEKYIHVCLESILAQTAGYWEAVFVDDASTDDSVKIIEGYADKDARIRLLRSEKNGSAWAARARGILNISASVQYILFADADDTLQPQTVERAYEEMVKDPVDILHFGTNVQFNEGVDKKTAENYTKYLQPPVCALAGREVFDSFVDRSFEGHLWNKMFDAKLLQEVIGRIGAEHMLPKAQDKALYWAICWSKRNLRYRGIADKLYNYNYGFGVEGSSAEISLDEYKQYLCQAWTEDLIAQIMRGEPEVARYAAVLEKSRYNLLRHSVRNLKRLARKDRAAGIDMAMTYWNDTLDPARFVCAFAEFTWDDFMGAAEILKRSVLNKTIKTGRDFKTIGTYYHRMDNGGIQRVIAQIMDIWHGLGYRIVLFTDSDPSENDYDIPNYVKRVKIARPASKCKASNYAERGMSMARLIKENNVDCMVYHAYFSDVLLYDTAVCKSLDVPFILYVHNVFTKFLLSHESKFSTVAKAAGFANGVVCLSDTDKCWWTNFNRNVHVVLNPLTFDLAATKVAPRDGHNILFLCRMAEFPKRPNDAITIAKAVLAEIPDAKLYMVGDTDDKKYMTSLQNRIRRLHFEESIILCGFHKDVEQYYRECSIFLSCSAFEGFPLTLCEAMSHGLPVVMYELPYLQVAQGNEGIISVKQEDKESAARIITELFRDGKALRVRGDKGRSFLERLYETDLSKQWRDIFFSVTEWYEAEDASLQGQMFRMLIEDYYFGIRKAESKGMNESRLAQCKAQLRAVQADLGALEKIMGADKNPSGSAEPSSGILKELSKMAASLAQMNKQTEQLRRERAETEGHYRALLNSKSFKIGRIVTFIPRKIRDLLKKGK